MTTLTIDIINEKAIKLLEDMEHLQLIRIHTETKEQSTNKDWIAKYMGSMAKQPLSEVDAQLKELRNAW